MLRKAYLEISNLCNLRCSFCPGTRRAPRMLTPEEFRLLAGKLRGHTEYLYFHLMGEPLLHPELKELLLVRYGEIFLKAVGEGTEGAYFYVSCPDCVFLVLLFTEINTA